uniref:ANK_REP_REGION domain-containing protein n=1 Tax=Macrostomum lignano TaxID=282301 RepID=A0A1I8FS02_9PLAT
MVLTAVLIAAKKIFNIFSSKGSQQCTTVTVTITTRRHGHSHGGPRPVRRPMTPGTAMAHGRRSPPAAAAPIPMDSEGKAYPTSQQQQQQQQVQQDTSNWDMVKACQYGVVPRVRELLNSGFDANTLDSQGVSPLHWAAINNRLEIMQMLVNHRAPLCTGPVAKATCLPACLLIADGRRPLLTDAEGLACLHLAAQFGYTHILAYLLAKGADPNLRDCKGMTALMWTALRVLQPDATRVLLAFDANPNARTAANTPAHFAALGGNQIVLGLPGPRRRRLDGHQRQRRDARADSAAEENALAGRNGSRKMMSDRGMLRDSSASAGGFFRSLATRENRRWVHAGGAQPPAGLRWPHLPRRHLLLGLAVFFRLVFSRKCLGPALPHAAAVRLAVGSEVILTSTCVLLMFPYNSYGDIVLLFTTSIVRTCEDPSASFDNFLLHLPHPEAAPVQALRHVRPLCGPHGPPLPLGVYNCVGVANHRTLRWLPHRRVVLGTSMFLKMFLSYVYHPDSSCSLDWDTVRAQGSFHQDSDLLNLGILLRLPRLAVYLFWVAMLLLSQLWQMLCVNMTTNERF